jgi:hypothetical protein
MTISNSADHSQARAIIIAAVIGVAGAIIAAIVGREWGERRAEQDTHGLEARLEQQEHALHTFEAQLSARDATIQSLTNKLEQSRASRGSIRGPANAFQRTVPAMAANADGNETTKITSRPSLPSSPSNQESGAQSRVEPSRSVEVQPQELQSQSSGGLTVTILGCTATGAAVACEMKVTNIRPDRSIRLWAENGSRLIDQAGNETRAAAASLGTSTKTFWWSENNLAEGISVRATLFFEGVPAAATEASLLQVTFGEGNASFGVKFHNITLKRD